MPIHLKLAKGAREIDDALWLRHEVFVIEDGKFGGRPLRGSRLVDRFDAFPDTSHMVAYENDEPVATVRLIKDSEAGMPVDELLDFGPVRAQLLAENAVADGQAAGSAPVQFGSAGMFAIRSRWRRRRDVIRAMFRMAAAALHRRGVTHVLAAVNHETAGMYRRFGFIQRSEKVWNEEIGDHIIALTGTTEDLVAWARGKLPETVLSLFEYSCDRMVLRAGESVFLEGEVGEHAFVVDSGEIRITRERAFGEELTLAHLGRGELFGELALIDDKPRSASAFAVSDTELMTLDRETFQHHLREHPEHGEQLFQVFSSRMRSMGELAMVLAFAPAAQRLEFALELARGQASRDPDRSGRLVFRGGARELARLAAVDEPSALAFLEQASAASTLEFSARHIVFLD
ncbi:N-acyl amino acid synthase FeeM domain-containing protein [Thioalkalivibrio sp.]|uniref:N-acyl amino acid synthase FeeM domain-containing protein n=1 Tax=Thioalkalivibrio sp. TaxID=2093813 RepID=UPI00397703BF